MVFMTEDNNTPHGQHGHMFTREDIQGFTGHWFHQMSQLWLPIDTRKEMLQGFGLGNK